jgi:CheY-like chemotaxis protein
VHPKVTVLVVDDDVANLRTFQRVFRRTFRVLMAVSSEEAVELLRTESPDVAFVDYSMPVTNGLALLRVLREQCPTMVSYLLTGYADLPEINQMKNSGLFRAVLSKPWDRECIERAATGALTSEAPCRLI